MCQCLSLSFSPSSPPSPLCGVVQPWELDWRFLEVGGVLIPLCHPAMRGDPGIRALLVQAGSLETDWGWHRGSSGRKEGDTFKKEVWSWRGRGQVKGGRRGRRKRRSEVVIMTLAQADVTLKVCKVYACSLFFQLLVCPDLLHPQHWKGICNGQNSLVSAKMWQLQEKLVSLISVWMLSINTIIESGQRIFFFSKVYCSSIMDTVARISSLQLPVPRESGNTPKCITKPHANYHPEVLNNVIRF